MNDALRCLALCNIALMTWMPNALAQLRDDSPERTVTDFSTRMTTLINGPIVKLFGVVILLVGVGSLLRGRHTVAMSCGVAFVVLLFLPFFLERRLKEVRRIFGKAGTVNTQSLRPAFSIRIDT